MRGPEWDCIQVAVFTVLQLPHPSPAQPYIKGLLDPCTNSMTSPNIPAEKLYDKKVSHPGSQTVRQHARQRGTSAIYHTRGGCRILLAQAYTETLRYAQGFKLILAVVEK